MTAKLTSFRIHEDLKGKLAELAKQQDRPVTYLINAAIKRMIQDHEAMVQAVTEGIAQLDAGKGIPHDKAMRRMSAAITDAAKRTAV